MERLENPVQDANKIKGLMIESQLIWTAVP